MKSTLAPRTCRQCGREFLGGPRAWYCPECRQERQRQQVKRFKAKRQADRPLGSIDRCVVCGKEYTVNSARQKYCPACAYDAFRAVDRVQGRGNLKRSIDKYGPEYAKQVKAKKLAARRQAKRPKVCKICGREFVPDATRRFYCSDLCHKKAKEQAALKPKFVKCKICGKIFVRSQAHKVCCSDLCNIMAHKYSVLKTEYKQGRIKNLPDFNDFRPGGRFFEKNRARFAGPAPALPPERPTAP